MSSDTARASKQNKAPDTARKSPAASVQASRLPAYARGPVQTKVAVGDASDSYEREADSVAGRVASGVAVAPQSISRVAPGGLSRIPQDDPESAVQKRDAGKEKKPDEKPIQKAEDKKAGKPAPKLEEKKPEQKKAESRPLQKADAKKPEPPKADEKKHEKKPVQKWAVQRDEAGKQHPAPSAPARQSSPEGHAAAQDRPGPAGTKGARPEDHAAKGPAADAMSNAADRALADKGPGRALHSTTLKTLESRLSADLSHVRVHDDDRAREAARELHARAFTHGSDIFLGPGESDADAALMAHEVTHVIQQSDDVMRKQIQRKAVPGLAALPGPAAPADKAPRTPSPASGVIQRANGASPAAPAASNGAGAGNEAPPSAEDFSKIKNDKLISAPELHLPAFKLERHKADYANTLTLKSNKDAGEGEEAASAQAKPAKRNTKQIAKFRAAVGTEGKSAAKLKEKLAAPYKTPEGQEIFFLKSNTAEFYIFGLAADIQTEAQLPYWDRDGKEHLLDVDHKKEIQLGGEDVAANYELLDFSANRSSGPKISNAIKKAVQSKLKPYIGADANKHIWPALPTVTELLAQGYTIQFEKAVGDLPVKGDSSQYWSLSDIHDGVPLEKLRPMTPKEIENKKQSLMGGDNKYVIYTASSGGEPRYIDRPFKEKELYPGFLLKSANIDPGGGGSITGEVKNPHLGAQALERPIGKASGIVNGGYIDDIGMNQQISKLLKLKTLSPIIFTEAHFNANKGLIAVGQVMPSVPLIKDIGIDVVVEGPRLRLRKLFDTGSFKFPAPIKVTDSSLEIFIEAAADARLGIEGEVNFEISKVGKGYLKSSASAGADGVGFEVDGKFNFDSKLFDKAEIEAWYRKDAFGAKGILAITQEGKVKGIKSASVEASYDEGKLTATGSADLSIPGVKSAGLNLSYDDKEGLVIGGEVQLADNIPGIESGSGKAQVRKKPDAEGYDISASGTAVPKIPGISSALAFAYENGAITIEGSVGYEKGMLKGTLLAGATNRPVDADGKPGQGEPTQKMRTYGGGELELKLAPWLQAKAGVKLLPNGEVEVSGEIRLPDSLPIFNEKKFDKNIFSINLDIPIIGVSAAGQNIGIFATIGGGLDLSAGIGPAELQQLAMGVTYNPKHEDQTRVVGGAKLHIPAHAGLRLFVRGALGVGIPLVDARAGLEVGGTLGLEGALDVAVNIDWTPTKGIVLDALGSIYVEPKFKFDVTAFVTVDLDLWIETINLYSMRKELASFEYGSNLRFGLEFPLHYEEGKPFNVSLSDLKLVLPDINAKDVLSGLVKQIAG